MLREARELAANAADKQAWELATQFHAMCDSAGCEISTAQRGAHVEKIAQAIRSYAEAYAASAVARERERWRDTLQDLADEYTLSGACEDECNHRRCVARKRALCAANALLDLMREVQS